MNELIINGIYRHFKGNLYQVIGVANHSEDLSEYVVYKRLDSDKLWIRSKEMFLSEVDKTKYPNVSQQYRFELIKK